MRVMRASTGSARAIMAARPAGTIRFRLLCIFASSGFTIIRASVGGDVIHALDFGAVEHDDALPVLAVVAPGLERIAELLDAVGLADPAHYFTRSLGALGVVARLAGGGF